MPDIFDTAQKLDLDMQAEIQRVATAPKPGMEPVGVCHNCGEPVPVGLLFCLDDPTDPNCTSTRECRDELERRLSAQKRNGG